MIYTWHSVMGIAPHYEARTVEATRILDRAARRAGTAGQRERGMPRAMAGHVWWPRHADVRSGIAVPALVVSSIIGFQLWKQGTRPCRHGSLEF